MPCVVHTQIRLIYKAILSGCTHIYGFIYAHLYVLPPTVRQLPVVFCAVLFILAQVMYLFACRVECAD